MYLILKWVSLGILAFCCITRGEKSRLDEGGKLMKKLIRINERIQNLGASVDEIYKRSSLASPTSLDTGTRRLYHPLQGQRTLVCYLIWIADKDCLTIDTGNGGNVGVKCVFPFSFQGGLFDWPSYPIYGERRSSNQKDAESDRETSFESLEKYSTSTGSFFLNDKEKSNEDVDSSNKEDVSEGGKGKSAKDIFLNDKEKSNEEERSNKEDISEGDKGKSAKD